MKRESARIRRENSSVAAHGGGTSPRGFPLRELTGARRQAHGHVYSHQQSSAFICDDSSGFVTIRASSSVGGSSRGLAHRADDGLHIADLGNLKAEVFAHLYRIAEADRLVVDQQF